MHPIAITGDTEVEAILILIEDEIAKYQISYTVLSFAGDVKDSMRKRIVVAIKKHFDIFVVLKSEIPKEERRIEEYFFYGVHGIYFDTISNNHSKNYSKSYSKEETEIMSFATGLFPRGWIFANTQNNKSMIEALLALKIIPVLQKSDSALLHFIKSHESFNKISSNLIKSVPLLDERQDEHSLADKIKMKMLLETFNLRHKLMIKSIDESFNSSGL